jgi:ABC-type Fe3+-siderophore transport system permease subunit
MARRPTRAEPDPSGRVVNLRFGDGHLHDYRFYSFNGIVHFHGQYDTTGRLTHLKVLVPTAAPLNEQTGNPVPPTISYEAAWLKDEYTKSVKEAEKNDAENKARLTKQDNDRVREQVCNYCCYRFAVVLFAVLAVAVMLPSAFILSQKATGNVSPEVAVAGVAAGAVLGLVAYFFYNSYSSAFYWDRENELRLIR